MDFTIKIITFQNLIINLNKSKLELKSQSTVRVKRRVSFPIKSGLLQKKKKKQVLEGRKESSDANYSDLHCEFLKLRKRPKIKRGNLLIVLILVSPQRLKRETINLNPIPYFNPNFNPSSKVIL